MPTPPEDPRHREIYDLAVRIGLAWRELRRGASTSGLREFLYGSDEESIEQGQMDTLDILAQRPSWRMSELADALHVEPSTATRAVERLVKAGMAERQASADDGRVVRVLITPVGRCMHETVVERRTELLTFILKSYRRSELPVFADMLERMVTAVDDFVSTHPAAPTAPIAQ
ncbi:MAG: MarR family transcriptional regulator [Actinomycetia bacterium]|nr:MarR family transcriptional regulator [Actinomycetes bacterium]